MESDDFYTMAAALRQELEELETRWPGITMTPEQRRYKALQEIGAKFRRIGKMMMVSMASFSPLLNQNEETDGNR